MLAKDGKKSKGLETLVSKGVFVSPKLNGYRCLAVKEDGVVTLYTRNGVEYSNFPQIEEALKLIPGNFALDGEIMSDDFNSMQKTAMSSKSKNTVGEITYYVFGWIPFDEFKALKFTSPTNKRLESLFVFFEAYEDIIPPCIKEVKHEYITSLSEALALEAEFLSQGYEGAMLLPNIPYYLGRKSNALLKLKTFQSMDCTILSLKEGEGKNVGKLGALVVMQENGITCDVGTGFSDEDRAEIFSNPNLYLNRIIEVQYQELTPHKRMQFPSFKRWRDLDVASGKV
jgi:DNA ligase-1